MSSNDQTPNNQFPAVPPPTKPAPAGRRVLPLSPGRQAALPLSSRSPAAWAAALVDLGDPRDALVEITASGLLRWWSPQPGRRTADGQAGSPDPLQLVWCRRAAPDVELVALAVGALVAPGPNSAGTGGEPGAPMCVAVAATRCGEYAVTVGNWREGTTTVAGRGAAVDAVLLYLGLSTAPEARTPADLVCSMWVDRLLAAGALHPGRVRTWADAVRHHPLGAARPDVDAAQRRLQGPGPIRMGPDTSRRGCGAGRVVRAQPLRRPLDGPRCLRPLAARPLPRPGRPASRPPGGAAGQAGHHRRPDDRGLSRLAPSP